MDDIDVKIEFKGESGSAHTFIHHYDLTKNEDPKSSGIYVFAKAKNNKNYTVLDIQFLASENDIRATVQRMKDDGATHIFFTEGNDELQCDADIDDIKRGTDYRNRIA